MSEEPQRARAKCKKQDKQGTREGTSCALRLALCFLRLAFPLTRSSKQTSLTRLGYLTNKFFQSTDLPRRAAFRQGLRDLGYIEGQNIAVEYRVGDGGIEKLSEMMDELLRLKVDVIFVFTTSAVRSPRRPPKKFRLSWARAAIR